MILNTPSEHLKGAFHFFGSVYTVFWVHVGLQCPWLPLTATLWTHSDAQKNSCDNRAWTNAVSTCKWRDPGNLLILCKYVLWIYNSLSLFSLRHPFKSARGSVRCQGHCFLLFSPFTLRKMCALSHLASNQTLSHRILLKKVIEVSRGSCW